MTKIERLLRKLDYFCLCENKDGNYHLLAIDEMGGSTVADGIHADVAEWMSEVLNRELQSVHEKYRPDYWTAHQHPGLYQ